MPPSKIQRSQLIQILQKPNRVPLPCHPPPTDHSYLAAISSLFWGLSHSLVCSEGEFRVLEDSKLSLTCIQGSKMWYHPGLWHLYLLLARLAINTKGYLFFSCWPGASVTSHMLQAISNILSHP